MSEYIRVITSWLRSAWSEAAARLREPRHRVGAGFVMMLGAAVIITYLLSVIVLWKVPPIESLDARAFSQASILLADDGSEISRYYEQNRTWVALDSIAASTVNALIATEDHRFFRHIGVDPWRILGAALRTAGGDPQGGSTLTMQLVRNLFPEIQRDFVLIRKVKEWVTAFRLEARYSKHEILEAYLNTVPFVFNTYGIQTAARTYFGKSASSLSIPESATLVGMLKGTMFYNPYRHPERATTRRNTVLEQMRRAGYLSPAETEAYLREPLVLEFHHVTPEDNHAPYFAEYVRRWLNQWARDNGYDPYTDGLRVHTTLNLRLQQLAEDAVAEESRKLQAVADVSWSAAAMPFFSADPEAYLTRIDSTARFTYFWQRHPEAVDRLIALTPRYRQAIRAGELSEVILDRLRTDTLFMDSLKSVATRLEAGLVALEPTTGHVKAWVGGRDFRTDKYDHVAIGRRQPGSTFKPFVYAAALDNGYGPNDVFVDERITFSNPGGPRPWSPGNFGGVSGEAMPLRTALALSKNTITAQLTMAVGPSRVAAYAQRMGIESPLDEVPSIGLGTSDVSLLELTAAYTTIAHNGSYQRPVLVTHITDRDGRVVARFVPERREAISPNVSYALLDMLRGVISGGTGSRIRYQYRVRGDLAGKTGTTQRGADGWFVLMHPDLVTGSWVGFNSPLVYFRTTYWGQGAHTALRVVGQFLSGAALSDTGFSPPPNYTPPRSTRVRAVRADTVRALRPRGLDSLRISVPSRPRGDMHSRQVPQPRGLDSVAVAR